MFRPNEAAQMTTPLRLQRPVNAVSYGVNIKTYENDNGVISVEDTAQVVCWYRPDIKSDCRVVLLDGSEDTDNAKYYEILGEPENIEQRNMFLKFKVRRIKGGV